MYGIDIAFGRMMITITVLGSLFISEYYFEDIIVLFETLLNNMG